MRQIICLIGLIFLCINSFFSQHDVESKLLQIEEKIYLEENDSMINKLLIEKVNYLINKECFDSRVLSEIKRINFDFIEDSLKRDFFWNAALLSYLNGETYSSLYYFNLYNSSIIDSSIDKTLLNFVINSGYNDVKADLLLKELVLRDTLFNALFCFNEVQNFEMKNKRIYGILGMIVPGSVLILNHEYKKGLTSMSLNTATIFAISWFLRQNLYLNMFGWGSNLITKFYIGGLTLTEKTVLKKEFSQKEKLAMNCELQLKSILEKYPLKFK